MRLRYVICDTMIDEYKAAVGLTTLVRRCRLRVDRNEDQLSQRCATVAWPVSGQTLVIFIWLSQEFYLREKQDTPPSREDEKCLVGV